MEVKIRTLAPIWTGNIDQKSDFLQHTGIVGSLRWWAETILRSMGKYACDPTSDKEGNEKRCPAGNEDKKLYCLACLILGATGMRRVFRLDINGGKRNFAGRNINIKPSERNRGWYLGSGIVEEVDLSITPLDKDFDENLVLVPLIIVSKWGEIGARTQHGYGVVEIENCPDIDFNRFKKAVEKITNKKRLSKLRINLRDGDSNGLPNLKEIFFAKVRFEVTDIDWWKRVDGIAERARRNQRNYYEGYINDQRMINWVNSGSVPIAPAIKNWLRYKSGARLWKTGNQNQDRRIENWLFGTIRNDKTSSKINISCAYKISDNLWEFRIWGWIPKDGFPGFDRDRFLNDLKQALVDSRSVAVPWNDLLGGQTKDRKLKVWREFDSPRDTVKQNESNISDYLQSLLRGEE